MKWTMGLWLAVAVTGCGYGQTKVAACPPTGCGNQFAATSPESLPAAAPASTPANEHSPVPADSDLPPDRTPATDALGDTQLSPLPDRALPPPIVPPNAP